MGSASSLPSQGHLKTNEELLRPRSGRQKEQMHRSARTAKSYKVATSKPTQESVRERKNANLSDETNCSSQDFTISDQPRSASQDVFETTELLEHVLSFLPMKKIFNVQSVCQQWKNTIATSPGLQQKMYLRLKSGRKEIWHREEVKSVVKANDTFHPVHGRLPTIIPVTLNPELQQDKACKTKFLGIDCMAHGGRVVLQWGPVNIREQFSLLDTFITDPPCKAAEISLTVRFMKPKQPIYWPSKEFPFQIWVKRVRAFSETGLTIQDILRAALNFRGDIECRDDLKLRSKGGPIGYRGFSWPFDASLREAIDLLPKYTGIKEFLDCPLMEVKIVLTDNVAAPTPAEWAAISAVYSKIERDKEGRH